MPIYMYEFNKDYLPKVPREAFFISYTINDEFKQCVH